MSTKPSPAKIQARNDALTATVRGIEKAGVPSSMADEAAPQAIMSVSMMALRLAWARFPDPSQGADRAADVYDTLTVERFEEWPDGSFAWRDEMSDLAEAPACSDPLELARLMGQDAIAGAFDR